jgi:hypothetical protein
MAHQNDLTAKLHVPRSLFVDLGDERAGGIEIEQVQGFGMGRHRFGHAMSRKDHRCFGAFGYLIELLDENRAFFPQPVHHIAIVDDLMAHIDRRAVPLERHHDHLNGAVDPGAKSTRVRTGEG